MSKLLEGLKKNFWVYFFIIGPSHREETKGVESFAVLEDREKEIVRDTMDDKLKETILDGDFIDERKKR